MTNDIEELIRQARIYILAQEYSEGYFNQIMHSWKSLVEWMFDNQILDFSKKVAWDYCDQKLGAHRAQEHWNYKMRNILRHIRMLVFFQEDGEIPKRGTEKEYLFIGKLGDMAQSFLSQLPLKSTTIAQKSLYLEKLCLFVHSKGMNLEEFTIITCKEFFDYAELSVTSQYHASICLKQFFNYLYDSGFISKKLSGSVLKVKKRHDVKLPTTYNSEEIKQMIGCVDRTSRKGKRDYLILLLASQYGWRASDIVNFEFSHIDWKNNKISFCQQKTGVPIEFPLLKSVGNALIDYMKNARPECTCPQVIVSIDKNKTAHPLKGPTIHSIVSLYLEKADIKDWRLKKHGPHALRHSLATNMLSEQNESLPMISSVLGHQSAEVTRRYLKVDIPKLRACCLNPPAVNSVHYKSLKEEK